VTAEISDTEAVKTANLGFYQAFSALDVEQMSRVWEPSHRALCVHPGWSALSGWEAIRKSWQSIFDNTALMHFNITGVNVVIQADCAWVSCVENITTVVEGRATEFAVQATNIFVRAGDSWRMVHHHGSPLAG
jgi:ketosteroid isomerase-like protein